MLLSCVCEKSPNLTMKKKRLICNFIEFKTNFSRFPHFFLEMITWEGDRSPYFDYTRRLIIESFFTPALRLNYQLHCFLEPLYQWQQLFNSIQFRLIGWLCTPQYKYMCIENTTLNTVHTQIPYNMDWRDLIWYATAYFRLIESFGSCIIELSNLICIFFLLQFFISYWNRL